MAQFIRQRNISDHDSNKIPQIDSFGEATLEFITAIYKSGWDKLNTTDKTPIRNRIQKQFSSTITVKSKHQNITKNSIAKLPPPISTCLPHKQVEEIRKWINQRQNKEKYTSIKSYA